MALWGTKINTATRVSGGVGKALLSLPVSLVLGVLRVVWADVLREKCFCMLGDSFPFRGIHSFTFHSDNHQEWGKGSKQRQ